VKIENKQRFTGIANDLEQKKLSLDPLMSNAFSDYYTQYDQIHWELIVRIPQMIVTYPDGLQRLTAQAPALLEYYRTVFLEKVKAHVNRLEERATAGWPKDRLINRHHGVSLELDEPTVGGLPATISIPEKKADEKEAPQEFKPTIPKKSESVQTTESVRLWKNKEKQNCSRSRSIRCFKPPNNLDNKPNDITSVAIQMGSLGNP
jgi:hypothetical protein